MGYRPGAADPPLLLGGVGMKLVSKRKGSHNKVSVGELVEGSVDRSHLTCAQRVTVPCHGGNDIRLASDVNPRVSMRVLIAAIVVFGPAPTSVLKSHKTREGASRSMAKASSSDILGLGEPLRSGQGAIRQF